MAMVGTVASDVTVMVSVAVFPAVSVAVTVMTWEPAARLMTGTFHSPALGTTEPELGATAPVVDQATVATATLSDVVPLSARDAAAVTNVGAGVGPVMVTVGAVVSRVIVTTAEFVIPELLVAVTVMVLAPMASGTDADQPGVPVADPAPPVAELLHLTELMPLAGSVAVPARAIGEELVAKVGVAGVVMVTVGAVVSRVTAITAVWTFPAVSVAETVIVLRPGKRATEADHVAVPLAVPEPPAEFAQVTLATATLSEAVPE